MPIETDYTTTNDVEAEGLPPLLETDPEPPANGYYDVPIATLDAVSLYPSIMLHENLFPGREKEPLFFGEFLRDVIPRLTENLDTFVGIIEYLSGLDKESGEVLQCPPEIRREFYEVCKIIYANEDLKANLDARNSDKIPKDIDDVRKLLLLV